MEIAGGAKELWKRVGYTEKVIDHFMNPRNVGEMKDADVSSTVGSVACGDMIKIFLKIDESDRIEKISFLSYGCASNIATTSVMTELVKGKSLEEAKKLSFKEIVEELGGLPAIKYHCAVLSIAGLRTAIAKYEVKKGRRPLDEDFVMTLLKGVLDPMTGRDIVSMGKVKSVSVHDGAIDIELDMSGEDEISKVIRAEILDAFEGLDVSLNVKLKS
ncbi:MAG: iron-sulfur cluster assembly scaffold protein [Thermoproteota archaeon]|nr:MAG: iron-sulfur cluster assembly scaffold protein [Candidatus Korarchaeota archaeon]RLG54844.1 MAG: iron-sulfur cluster assembly scaffold protein [Candidatus Korarchaeota archaeon]